MGRGRFAPSSGDNRESRPLAYQRARPRLLSLRTSALLGIDEPLQKYIARKQTLSSPASEHESRRVIEPQARDERSETRSVCVCLTVSVSRRPLSCARSRSGPSSNPRDRVRRHRGGEYRRRPDEDRGGGETPPVAVLPFGTVNRCGNARACVGRARRPLQTHHTYTRFRAEHGAHSGFTAAGEACNMAAGGNRRRHRPRRGRRLVRVREPACSLDRKGLLLGGGWSK